jgi:hypothetical protein
MYWLVAPALAVLWQVTSDLAAHGQNTRRVRRVSAA